MTGKYYSYINPKCEARPQPEGGCGVFARENIKKDELISLWGGRIVSEAELTPYIPRFTQRAVQLDEGLFLLSPEAEEPADCFNHSCDPNMGFFGQIGLVASRDIKAAEELCFDYAMSDGGPYDEFDCYCGSANCRKRITGRDWMIPELWDRYNGYFSPYIARRIEARKSVRYSDTNPSFV
jgi:SET domain-containing protein